MALFYNFATVFNVFIKGSWTLISASVFSLLKYTVLVELYMENLASPRYAIGKERSILKVFPDNCEISSLVLYQKSTSVNFLKVSYNVESETISMVNI